MGKSCPLLPTRPAAARERPIRIFPAGFLAVATASTARPLPPRMFSIDDELQLFTHSLETFRAEPVELKSARFGRRNICESAAADGIRRHSGIMNGPERHPAFVVVAVVVVAVVPTFRKLGKASPTTLAVVMAPVCPQHAPALPSEHKSAMRLKVPKEALFAILVRHRHIFQGNEYSR